MPVVIGRRFFLSNRQTFADNKLLRKACKEAGILASARQAVII